MLAEVLPVLRQMLLQFIKPLSVGLLLVAGLHYQQCL